jgi:hypothetical protein
MGKTAYSGPLYGAKALLWAVNSKDIGNSTTANIVASIIVPAGQDWYATDIHAYRGSTHSTAFSAAFTDDSTTIGSVSITSSAAGVAGATIVTPTAGEFEGQRIAAGSSVSFTVHNGGSSVASSQVFGWLYGYIRYVDSSRTLNT